MHGANFAEIEQQFVRDKINSDFTWRAFDTFSQLNPLSVPLSDARVAFVTTSGAHLPDDEPFDIRASEGDPSYRSFPIATRFEDLSLTHRGYDTKRAATDMNVVLPLDHLRSAESEGKIGNLSPTVYSFMGFVAETEPLIKESAPAVAECLRSDGVDLVLLAPT